jgi:hypothetical protein
MPVTKTRKALSNPTNNQSESDGQEKKVIGLIDLTVIGDIVYDKIVVTIEDENKSKVDKSKEYPGGALFVKTFLESDPAIKSKATISGYIELGDTNEDPSNKFWNIIIPKKNNTITLEKQEGEKPEAGVYRINGLTRLAKDADKMINVSLPGKQSTRDENFSILIVTDLGKSSESDHSSDGIGERKIKQPINGIAGVNDYEWECYLRAAYKTNTKFNDSSMPWHFITISHPTESLFEQTVYKCFRNNSLRRMNEPTEYDLEQEMRNIKQKTLAIVYGDHLRSGCNLAIARRISIERTAQDFLQELHRNPLLIELGKFEHLVVRFGLLSVVHSYRIKNRRFHRLFFDPNFIYDAEYSNKLSGVVTGNQTVLLDNIIRQLLALTNEERNNPYDVSERIGVGIKLGIKDCRNRYDKGYGSTPDAALEFLDIKPTEPAFVPEDFFANRSKVGNFKEEEILAADIADERIPIAHPGWSILAQSAEYNLIQAAEDIVFYGIERAVNQSNQSKLDPIWSPIGRFGKEGELIVLERYELESYRSVQLLMEEAMTLENKAILSIAVFGPPGSGKSFVSDRIANSACKASQVTPILRKVNLASISESHQLIDKLDDAFGYYLDQKDKLKENKAQFILFFDEFDCSVNDKSLGWLKTFLPMMQDGEFSTKHKTHDKQYSDQHHQPILIFAGGTSHTYSNFSRQDFSGDPEDQLRFAQAKGPDFVSRLRGHIDILGPSKTNELDEGYVIRRAILLRTMFLKRICQFTKIADNDELENYLYRPFVRAMLTVSNYKHGARSMEAIIAMCAKLPGDKIGPASMPAHAQLNMHVDANEFLKLVHSARGAL